MRISDWSSDLCSSDLDVVTQLNWLDDKKDWSRWQLDQCQAARDTSLDWAVTAPALYACGAVATGVGAVVCGAAIAAYIIYANRYRRQSDRKSTRPNSSH